VREGRLQLRRHWRKATEALLHPPCRSAPMALRDTIATATDCECGLETSSFMCITPVSGEVVSMTHRTFADS
jgi:hypothetical protein